MVRGLDQGELAALVVCECQRGVLDPSMAIFPGLAEEAAARGMLAKIARLASAFRVAGLPVVHVHVVHRADLGGVVANSMITARGLKSGSMRVGTPEVEAMEGAVPDPSDYISARQSGVGMWYGTNLDVTLRSLRVDTIVLSGVSTNVAMFGGALGAVDRGYKAVLAEDATAGATADLHEWMVTNTLPLLATMSTVDDIVAELASQGASE
jgi:nicotinamidase-related amidase